MTQKLQRRSFLAGTSAAVLASTNMPNIVQSAEEKKVRVAGVGVGGKGWTDINGAAKYADVMSEVDVVKHLQEMQ